MDHAPRLVPLRDSHREHVPAADETVLGADPAEDVHAVVILRSRSSDAERANAVADLMSQPPAERKYLSVDEYAETHGATQEDTDAVVAFLRARGFRVSTQHASTASIDIHGSLRLFSDVFQVQFSGVQGAKRRYRIYSGALHVPEDVADIIEAVVGLDTRAVAEHHLHIRDGAPHASVSHVEAADVAAIYEFPAAGEMSGQCIGILTLGGGFHKSDMDAFFAKNKTPAPHITVVEAGAKNDPASSHVVGEYLAGRGSVDEQHLALWTIETTLDIQLAASFAPGAAIAVYFADDSEKGQYQALVAALTDAKNRPSVLSLSWGNPEPAVRPKWMRLINRLLEGAVLMGVTVCVSTGDSFASKDVNFPATSPFVLACGGTHLTRSGADETVWNETLKGFHLASVGGVSTLFDEPQWQHSAAVNTKTHKSGRGVPDVAGKADLADGYAMLVGGNDIAMGGTSAAAPMWAALASICSAALHARVGFLTPELYSSPFADTTRDILSGTNGVWSAGPGWDPCTGLGSPKGKLLLKALQVQFGRATAP